MARTVNIGTAKDPIWKVTIDGAGDALAQEAPSTLLTGGEPQGGFGVDDEQDDPPEPGEDSEEYRQEDLKAWREDLKMPDLTRDEMDNVQGFNEIPISWQKKLVEVHREQGQAASDDLYDRMTGPEMEEAMYDELDRESKESKAKKLPSLLDD